MPTVCACGSCPATRLITIKIEQLWKNTKRRATHCRYFPTFEALTAAVDEGLTHFATHPAAIKRLMGPYLAEVVALPAAA